MTRYQPVELLAPTHDRSAFDCGSVEQTTWLQRHALSAQQADTARTYVACRIGEPQVVGYYALVAGAVQPEDASERLLAGAGRYPVPIVVLARLGVDVEEQGHGLGAALLRDALLQTAAVAAKIGVRALLVHAETDAAARFYRHFDPAFESSPTDPLHLILLMKNIRAAIRKTSVSMS
ncbi:MAG: GNAT family N-acetyltransferase [Chloroflexota bacterium]